MAVGVGRSVGRAIELATGDAAEPSLQCMQAFLGPRYGSTIARVVTADASKEFRIDSARGGASVSAGSVLAEGSEGIAGAVVLVVRRQLANMAGRIGQRLVGSVLSRLVSVAAGGVGIVLIAKDIWDFRHGVMPIIASEMKSRANKDAVQEELARTIAEQIGEHTREIAAATADRILEIWREFRRAHLKVLDLAEREPTFKAFIETVRPERLARTDEVVGLVLAGEGEAGVTTRLGDGSLAASIETMPEAGMEIAREQRSLATALAWHAVANGQLAKVLEHAIHRRSKPEDFTRATLSRLLGLADRLAITRLAGVPRGARDALFELEDGELRGLARGMAEGELETLSRYMTGLARPAGQRILKAVALSPAKMQILAPARVRDALLASRDQAAAVDMMLRHDSGFDPTQIIADLRLALDGRVSPLLLWDRHPVAIAAAAVTLLLLMLLLRRLVRPARRPSVPRGVAS
jgi:hypothetical protein